MIEKTNKKSECYLCGKIFSNKNEWTKDHVPPKHLYLNHNKPKNLKTLKTCSYCNNKFAIDEEYFLDFLIITNAYRNLIAAKKWQERLIAIKKKPAYHERIKKALSLDDFTSSGGLYLGKVHNINIDYERRKVVTEKIIRGLHYLKYQERIEQKIEFYFPEDLYKPNKRNSIMQQTVLKEESVQYILKGLLNYPFIPCNCKDVFNSYCFRGEEEGKSITAWALTFYNYNLSIALIGDDI